jgi:hypothetical protein
MLVGVWVAPAAAQEPDKREHTGLEYRLQWATLRVDAFQDHIDNVLEGADLVDELIAEERASGHDTASIAAALADFRAAIAEAQSLRDAADQILDDKAGFDNDGQVEDPQQARDTLKNANEKLRNARQTLRDGRRELRQAMREYRQSRRGSE